MLSRFFALLLLSALAAASSRGEPHNAHIAMMKRNNLDDSTSSSSTLVEHTTLREADEGVVDGECHNLGLHGEKKQRKKIEIILKNCHLGLQVLINKRKRLSVQISQLS